MKVCLRVCFFKDMFESLRRKLLIIFKILKTDWERVDKYSSCRLRQKMLLALLQKKHVVENTNPDKGKDTGINIISHNLYCPQMSACVLRSGSHGLLLYGGKTYSPSIYLLLLQIPSFSLKHPVPSCCQK